MSVVEGGRPAGARGLGAWLARVAPKSAHGTVTIAIVSNGKMRALNRAYRGLDKPTDVLSFPTRPRPRGRTGVAVGPLRRPEAAHLGDIVIARGIARKQAGNLGHSFAIETRVLALHGLLHLLGYDHEVDDGRMARVEGRLRRKAGLPTGLIARSS